MGTRIDVTLWHEDKSLADKAIAAVFAEMERIDQTFSSYIETSELSQLNRTGAKGPQAVSPEMMSLLKASADASELTEGAFDITYASVGHLYNYREKKQPTDKQRQQKQAAIDYHFVKLEQQKVTYLHHDVVVDLGGIAKGHAVDRAIQLLRDLGIESASVSAGGDSRLMGDRRGRPWIVGIKNPRKDDDIAIRLPLSDVAVSTSGDYERYFIDEATGERVHHIINPRSGKSARSVISVTIVGSEGIQTDPLSTGVFVMGVEKGLHLINQLEGIDVIIIDAKGKVHFSKGLATE